MLNFDCTMKKDCYFNLTYFGPLLMYVTDMKIRKIYFLIIMLNLNQYILKIMLKAQH